MEMFNKASKMYSPIKSVHKSEAYWFRLVFVGFM